MHAIRPRSYPVNPAVPDLLQHVLPEGAHGAEHRGALPEAALYFEEAQYVNGLLTRHGERAQRRVHDFTQGRVCARRALAVAGVYQYPLLSREDRLPQWPQSLVGSITHTDDYCAVLVGPKRRFAGLGIDAEVIAAVQRKIWPQVLMRCEWESVSKEPPALQQHLAAIAFSAKEAFYKCQYPITGEFVDFKEISVRIVQDRFQIIPHRLLQLERSHPAPYWGRYIVGEDLVLCTMFIQHAS